MASAALQVLLHVSDRSDDVARALTSAATLVGEQPQLRVRIIVNGPALDGLTGQETVEPAAGVRVEACEVGMTRREISAGDLRPGVETVASAVVALVQGQHSGAAYIRI